MIAGEVLDDTQSLEGVMSILCLSQGENTEEQESPMFSALTVADLKGQRKNRTHGSVVAVIESMREEGLCFLPGTHHSKTQMNIK